MTAYQIKDWGKLRGRHRLFECNQSARYDNPSWFPFPINFEGDCYQMLMTSDEGERAYGIFTALCSLAATTPLRGLLADESGSFSFRKIGAKTRLRASSVEWGIKYLGDPEIAWIEGVSDLSAARRIKSLARSKLGANSEPEQAMQSKHEQADSERDKSMQGSRADSTAAGGMPAHAMPALPETERRAALRQALRDHKIVGRNFDLLADSKLTALDVRMHWERISLDPTAGKPIGCLVTALKEHAGLNGAPPRATNIDQRKAEIAASVERFKASSPSNGASKTC